MDFIIKTNNRLILLKISMVIGSICSFFYQNTDHLYFLNCKNTSANSKVYILKSCPIIRFLHHCSCIIAHCSYVTSHCSLLIAHCLCLSFPPHNLTYQQPQTTYSSMMLASSLVNCTFRCIIARQELGPDKLYKYGRIKFVLHRLLQSSCVLEKLHGIRAVIMQLVEIQVVNFNNTIEERI